MRSLRRSAGSPSRRAMSRWNRGIWRTRDLRSPRRCLGRKHRFALSAMVRAEHASGSEGAAALDDDGDRHAEDAQVAAEARFST